MVVYGGYDVDVWYKTEATYGALLNGGTYVHFGPVRSLSVGHKRERVDTTGVGSRTRREGQQVKQDDTLSIEVPLQIDAAGVLDNWEMLITAATTPLQNYSIAYCVDTQYFIAKGVLVDEVEVSTALNELIILKFTFSVQKIDGPYANVTLAGMNLATLTAIQTDDLAVWKDGYIAKVDGASGTWTTPDALVDEANSWSVSIKNGVEKIWGWTNAYPRSAYPKALEVSGSVSLFLENYNELGELSGETYSELHFYVSATKYIKVTNATFDSVDVDYSEVDLIELSVPYVGNVPSFIDA